MPQMPLPVRLRSALVGTALTLAVLPAAGPAAAQMVPEEYGCGKIYESTDCGVDDYQRAYDAVQDDKRRAAARAAQAALSQAALAQAAPAADTASGQAASAPAPAAPAPAAPAPSGPVPSGTTMPDGGVMMAAPAAPAAGAAQGSLPTDPASLRAAALAAWKALANQSVAGVQCCHPAPGGGMNCH
ncbi:hypothetical protein [Rhodospirillum centenum]|uniref:Secreted protein n=1 Tax=Rhodospirillum centenum (strain ATCC 51521 / SW) TaxID=414684 RepID=B6IVF2_RHOCS|nr:hypothetical protein [Rhodospirillum centenum]ACJ00276.1 hypothetical protein RC1_2908 [Rhodospirillum centenum SW]